MKTESKPEIIVRPLRENDLPDADRIMRLAFGTFLGLPDPMAFMGDAEYVHARWHVDPGAAFGAEIAGELAGSNFATNWGSVGFFGPLTIRPDLWDRGVGKRLMEPIMECLDRWGTTHAGLFTFAHSPKHAALYEKFGFWPRFLTRIMSKTVEPMGQSSQWTKYSDVKAGDRQSILAACSKLTDGIFDGLDVSREINSVADQKLGETVLLWDGDALTGLAVCHCGSRTEAGSGTCYVKFAAARTGPNAGQNFDRLLIAVEEMAAQRNLTRLVAGVNTGRREACRVMRARNFRTDFQGVAMHRPNENGYSRADCFVIDDWR